MAKDAYFPPFGCVLIQTVLDKLSTEEDHIVAKTFANEYAEDEKVNAIVICEVEWEHINKKLNEITDFIVFAETTILNALPESVDKQIIEQVIAQTKQKAFENTQETASKVFEIANTATGNSLENIPR